MTTVSASTPIELVEGVYATLPDAPSSAVSASAARSRSPRRSSSTTSLDPQGQELVRGESYADFHPDPAPCRTPRPRWRCSSS